MGKLISRLTTSINISFYALFLTVPLAMSANTHELFEFNKMWLVFAFSIIIFFLWGAKIIAERRITVRRTPFDIPIILFLLSQLISTILSMDPHTSFWGYYTRFNGGFLSTLSYIFLYYAFATNVLTEDKEESVTRAFRMLFAGFISIVIVALWGLPSHFGYDPTCLVFRGELNVSCWTEAFQPKIRMFSTLGQPNWLAALLAIFLPVTISLALNQYRKAKQFALDRTLLFSIVYCLLSVIFYLDLLWTASQSGFLAFWSGNIIFGLTVAVLLLKKNNFSLLSLIRQKIFQILVISNVLFLIITFLTTIPITSLQSYTLPQIIERSKSQTPLDPRESDTKQNPQQETPAQPALESSITGSGNIRKIVWKGAIEIFKEKPLFGSGVETYAYAYYQHRPIEHNLTSEWDYLYNKAHNEHLNYLATTGIFGLGTFLLFAGWFLYYAGHEFFNNWKKNILGNPILPALVGSFIAIHVSDFFGFSVVIVNLYMFLIPLFFFALSKGKGTATVNIPQKKMSDENTKDTLSPTQLMVLLFLGAFCIYSLIYLFNFWRADKEYALGYNYQRVGEYILANQRLEKAVKMRNGEDLYKNELSINLAAIAILLAQQKDENQAGTYAQRAKDLSDEVARKNPNNVTFWKARTRVLFSLAQLNPVILPEAINAIEHAQKLAPTDAKILYNKALLYDQAGKKDEALKIIDDTIKIKPNYRDAYFAKGLLLSQRAEAEKDPVKKQQYLQQAKTALEFTLKNINPLDNQTKELLKTLE